MFKRNSRHVPKGFRQHRDPGQCLHGRLERLNTSLGGNAQTKVVRLSCSHTEHEANQTVREVCKFHYWLTSRSFWLSSYLSVSTSPYYVVTSWPPRKFLNIPKISTRRLTYIHSCPLRIHYWLTSRSTG